MVSIYRVGNAILRLANAIAASESCCCGGGDGPCSVSFRVDFIPTPESAMALGALVVAQGYANSFYIQSDSGNFAMVVATCCASDQQDVAQVLVTGAGNNQAIVTIPRCVEAAPP